MKRVKVGDRFELDSNETGSRFVILWRRGDIRGVVRKVGRKWVYLTTDGGVRLAVEPWCIHVLSAAT